MPNWCENSVNIYIKKSEESLEYIKKLEEAINNSTFNEFVIPYSDMGLSEWDYYSCIEHWGTKWDIQGCCDCDSNISDDYINLHFSYDTAWGPNIPVLNRLYEILKDIDEDCTVESYYAETGSNFCGRFINGEDNCQEINHLFHIIEENYNHIKLINSDGKLKFIDGDSDIFFIEISRSEKLYEDIYHNESDTITEIKCFSNYFGKGNGEVSLYKLKSDLENYPYFGNPDNGYYINEW